MFTRCIKLMIMTPKELMIHFEVSRPFWSLVHAVATTKAQADERYVFSSFRPVFGWKQNIFWTVFEADFRILFNYRLLYWEVFLHFGTILAWEVPFPPRHPFRPWPLKRAHLQLHNPMNPPPHAWDMWRDGASRRPPERWWDELRSVKESCSKQKHCLRLSPFFPILAVSANMFYLHPYPLKTTQFDEYEYFTVNMYTHIFICICFDDFDVSGSTTSWLHLKFLEIERSIFAWGSNQ